MHSVCAATTFPHQSSTIDVSWKPIEAIASYVFPSRNKYKATTSRYQPLYSERVPIFKIQERAIVCRVSQLFNNFRHPGSKVSQTRTTPYFGATYGEFRQRIFIVTFYAQFVSHKDTNLPLSVIYGELGAHTSVSTIRRCFKEEAFRQDGWSDVVHVLGRHATSEEALAPLARDCHDLVDFPAGLFG